MDGWDLPDNPMFPSSQKQQVNRTEFEFSYFVLVVVVLVVEGILVVLVMMLLLLVVVSVVLLLWVGLWGCLLLF